MFAKCWHIYLQSCAINLQSFCIPMAPCLQNVDTFICNRVQFICIILHSHGSMLAEKSNVLIICASFFAYFAICLQFVCIFFATWSETCESTNPNGISPGVQRLGAVFSDFVTERCRNSVKVSLWEAVSRPSLLCSRAVLGTHWRIAVMHAQGFWGSPFGVGPYCSSFPVRRAIFAVIDDSQG